MPAIRDLTYAYESTTTDAGLTIPICAYAQGDLLLCFCMSDTGAPTWTPPTGFQELFTLNSTTANVCFWKIAGASEGDLVIGSTVNETYNGAVIAVRDIDQKRPFLVADTSTYADSNVDGYQVLNNVTTGVAQSFAGVATRYVANAYFFLRKSGSPTGTAVVKLYAHSGSLGSTSVPTGAALATSDTFDVSTLTTSGQLIEFKFPSGQWFRMVTATNYVIALEYTGTATDFVEIGFDGSSPGHAGNYSSFASSSWTANSGRDLAFTVQHFDYAATTNPAGSRVTHGTVTTQRNDSIVFYWQSSSVVAMPTFLDGPVHHLSGGDGSAESMGIGWAYQRAAGTTPADIVCCSYASTNLGVRAQIAVNPPAGGATVLPPHIVQDTSAFQDFLHGTTGFNSNTGTAATADTNFGTTMGSFTADDATVAAIADVGVNSFNSMAGLTSTATANRLSGAEMVFAAGNRPNIGSQNLLCHQRPSGPAHAQRWSTIGSGRGSWFGMRSNTTGTSEHKVWQVGGTDAPWGLGAHVPIVINADAANAKQSSGTVNTAAITAVGFWVGSLVGLTAQIGFGMLWLMGRTTIAGGTSTAPLDIPGIVRTVAGAKVRVSALLQGAKQMLLLQDVQIGNGGTNPVYLNLDATAIEFPGQYDAARKEVNYNSVDNKIGLLYYPGQNDTIIHRNSVISSRSRYFWGLHSAAHTGAAYDFSGLQVIGAGTITLNRAITVSGLVINDYSTIDASNATLDECMISGCPAGNDTLTTNASTSITKGVFDVRGLTAGNRWCSVANPSIFANCEFTGSASTGHAIRITAPGVYALNGNTFLSFGANETTSAAIFNDSGGAVTLNVSGGTTPTVRNGTGATTQVNNNVTVTVTANVSLVGAEIRVYDLDNIPAGSLGTELAGVESHDAANYAFSVAASNVIWLQIMKTGYEEFGQQFTAPTTSGDLPITLKADINT